ncbi:MULTISPECIES: HlyD family type I secretion periplasmic adaptor subunit [unclassified Mesorhizobium]|uniref:HlyD family type I secretion periplasmic adaptor subunit n=1 Tax=unclassified Mesorhizobium TaxID=325217 RepID=UPI000FCB8A4E|nr:MULTISPECIES: HlyD family type I secretion periplasmic adaptor subunit [unclassified Mesorhizobium]RUW31830.1 HlyD family type I secretion periplasmic adaptor subunit [Mesorhizobium sp. M1E.F.Ca.ET.041.01.1.1]RWD91338.1 MAG: HlyD family type I secretion periplasmic adaptor subunit [Mesorhizobium sp.]RWD94624.1 MAG: HlyD family type I secretion periplasmic adaptor subunit [Mesorhizobium sp.]TIV55284.1 MAG: HlyD family type I secretion periplasmic adaptor subunit [Mesorhizobium sp.]
MRDVLPRLFAFLPSYARFDAGQRSSLGAPGGIGPSLVLGLTVTCLLIVGGGLWLGFTKIAGAVIAPATVVVESNTKKVQHQTGGTISGIFAQDGDHVRAGNVLVRLDDTLPRANLQIISEDLDRATVRLARLEAERQGLATMPLPASLQAEMSKPDLAALVNGERALFETRASELAGQKALLKSQTQQIERQLEGLKAQQVAMDESAALLGRDLTDVDALYSKKLVSKERLSNVRLDATRAKGESGRLAAAVAEAQTKISETELQILQLDEKRRSDVTTELRETEAKRTELNERRIVALDELTKTEIRAPQSGTIQQSTVHTVGGVVAPGELLMTIVPDADNLVVDALIPPPRVDDVRSGQPVSIRFPAFDGGTTPACQGTVKWISADLIKDQQRQVSYFSARIGVENKADCLTDAKELKPGMPAEVHISTDRHSVWSYLLKPLTDQMSRAFR